ncbi:MAG: FtsX-like permease family protein [Pseudohongiella sp.]|nr:FtsX-like permease family protein [Pseudohongiella sp.]
MAIGIASFAILGIYALSELSYDRHYDNYERIYRLALQDFRVNPSVLNRDARTSDVLAPMMADNYIGIQDYVRIETVSPSPSPLIHDNASLYWDDVVFADENIFEFFNHEIVAGDPATALVEPRTIAISKSMAEDYFGERNPIGEILSNDFGIDFKVTLVFEDLKETSTLTYSAIMSRNSLVLPEIGSLDSQALTLRMVMPRGFTYFLLREGYSTTTFNEDFKEMLGTYSERLSYSESNFSWFLEPLSSLHLASITDGSGARLNRFRLTTYASLGLFILIISFLNFTNLAVSKFSKRANEIGLRKVVGADRSQIAKQFMFESFVITLIALLVGLSLVSPVQSLIPIAGFLDSSISLGDLFNPLFFAVIVGMILIIGSMSGLYPAFYLSSIRLLDIIKGGFRSSTSALWFKEALVFLQFTVSIVVGSCAILMIQQIQSIQNAPLGFDKENKILVRIHGNENVARIPVLENLLRSHAGTKSTAITNTPPFRFGSIGTGSVESNEGERSQLAFYRIYGDSEYIETFDIEIIQGRDLSVKGLIQSPNAVIVNEAFVRAMGWDKPIGKILYTPGAYGLSEVVGVAKDYNFLGFDQPIEPMAINTLDQQQVIINAGRDLPGFHRFLVVSVQSDNLAETIAFIQQSVEDFDPEHPFLFNFVEDDFAVLHEAQSNQAILMSIFAVISLVLSLAGILGLVAFKSAQHTKELGIRKVLGANSMQLLILMLKGLLLNISIAALSGCFIASLIFSAWQEQFSAVYRISVDPGVFLISSCVGIFIVIVITTIQTAQKIRQNPVESLRYE